MVINITSSIIQLKSAYGYTLQDIKVLSPLRETELGTRPLINLLQSAFNTTKDFCQYDEKEFKVGDKVIHTQNNYELEVCNGETGVV